MASDVVLVGGDSLALLTVRGGILTGGTAQRSHLTEGATMAMTGVVTTEAHLLIILGSWA